MSLDTKPSAASSQQSCQPPPPPPRIWLPTEILFHVAEYLDRQSLGRASSVCRFWRDSLEPYLWADIPSHALGHQLFRKRLRDRQHYVQHLRIRSHYQANRGSSARDKGCTTAVRDGDELERLGWSTDPVENRLLSLCIKFVPTYLSARTPSAAASSTHHPMLLASLAKCPESRILDLNQSTLRELYLEQWPPSLYGDLLQSMLALSHLRRLTLADWSHVNGRAIRLILESCPHLESLQLPMNTMTPDVTTLWELGSTVSTWKFEAEPPSEWPGDATQSFNGSSSTAALLQQITQQQPLRTKIEELVLDRSAISMYLVLNLSLVCPNLKVLSLEETYGLGYVDATSDLDQDEDDTESSEAGDSSGSDDTSEADNAEHVVESNNIVYGAEDSDREMAEGSSEQGGGAEEMSSGYLTPSSTYSTTLGEFQQPQSSDLVDTEVASTGEETQESSLLSFLDRLHEACPKIHSFNFNDCSSDGLDDYFMISLLLLWGSSDLKSIKARNVGIGSRMFLRTLAHTCGSTLTCLDISMDLPSGDGAGQQGSSLALRAGHNIATASEPKRVPETIALFQEFPALTFLDVRGVPIKTSWIESTPCIESSGKAHDSRMYQQLGRLTALCELVLTRIVKQSVSEPAFSSTTFTRLLPTTRKPLSLQDPTKTNVYDRYPSLDLSLDAGLDHLGKLVLLQRLDIRELGRHCLMHPAELEWVSQSWPSLESLEGLQDLSLTEEGDIQDEVRWLTFLQSQRPAVKVDWEHGKSRRRARGLERSQPNHSDLLADSERVDGSEGSSSRDELVEQDHPGGRCSRELMYESLRPRGGRSPSPLRTWY
ncbi:hypothetical protein BGZ73_005437 [Actinomortierella ambigua]|nr:hypothetical protein BGZ73_005437 [Actinomortierella ambigua]